MDCRKCPNTKCYINSNCLGSWLEFVQNFKTKKLISKGLKVFSEGDLVTGIYVVCSGKLKIIMKTDNSSEQILRLAGEGQVLGHRGLSKNMTYPISAETLTSCELAYIPHEEFFKLLRSNADLSFFMMMFFADELQRSEQKFRLRSLKMHNDKVAASLCMIIDAFGYKDEKDKKIDLTLNLEELSNFAETTKKTMVAVLNHFSDLKIIDWNQSKIVVVDEPKLRDLAKLEL